MATLNKRVSVLAAILSDIFDHSDTNFICILLANKCQQQRRKSDRKNTSKQTDRTPNEITVCLQTSHKRVT